MTCILINGEEAIFIEIFIMDITNQPLPYVNKYYLFVFLTKMKYI